jgi:hypothetical protein
MKILDIITEAAPPVTADAIAMAWIKANPEKAAAYQETLAKKCTIGDSLMRF